MNKVWSTNLSPQKINYTLSFPRLGGNVGACPAPLTDKASVLADKRGRGGGTALTAVG